MKTILLISCFAISCVYGASLGQKYDSNPVIDMIARQIVRQGLENFVIGGQQTTIEEYPWTISQTYLGAHRCGASIISATRGVTAAHCTIGTNIGYTTYRTGSSQHDAGGATVFTDYIIEHPQYNQFTTANDIALIWFVYPVNFNERSQPIALPAQDAGVAVGSLAHISGWGVTVEGSSVIPTYLQVGIVPIVSQAECSAAYGSSRITDDMICAGFPEGGIDACQGDSGGPLVYNFQLVGIVSWGAGCAQAGYPGVYARTAHFVDWIHANS